MSSLFCNICESDIILKNKSGEPSYVECDMCKNKYHSSCTKLSSSELKVFALKTVKRQMHWFCASCKSSDGKLDITLALVNLSERIQELNHSYGKLQGEMKSCYHESANGQSDIESLYAEFHEREKRSKNVIIYGIMEDTKLKTRERLIKDRQTVTSIIKEITSDDCVVSTMRLGDVFWTLQNKDLPISSTNKPRPIKVVLQNADFAIKVLKNKKKYEGEAKIGADRTIMQREYMKNLINQLNIATDNGINKNKYIKYVNGVPKIVDNKTNEKSTENSSSQEN